MLGKLIVNETLRNLEEWLWRFVCLDKYGLTLTNICLDAWNWLLVWLFRGDEGACIFLFWLYGSLWRVLLEHILDPDSLYCYRLDKFTLLIRSEDWPSIAAQQLFTLSCLEFGYVGSYSLYAVVYFLDSPVVVVG